MMKALALVVPAVLCAAAVAYAVATRFEMAKPGAVTDAAPLAPSHASAPGDPSAKCAAAGECSPEQKCPPAGQCSPAAAVVREERDAPVAQVDAPAGDVPTASPNPPDTEAFLRRVIASDAKRAVRGRATYDLARHLDTLSQLLVRMRTEGPEWRERIEAKVGKANAQALLARDPEKLSEEAETLLGRVCTTFGDIKTSKGTLDELAMEALFAVRHLAVGRKAPEIVGVDIDGMPMKLSDFRGKVVMISFYGYWCGFCVEFFPTERALVETFAGRPFALVGVNSDSREQYKKGLERIPLNWRSFFDGGSASGPIAATWQVSTWPTSYIIDHEGIVRFKDLRKLDTLKRAIEGLVATAERAVEGPVTR